MPWIASSRSVSRREVFLKSAVHSTAVVRYRELFRWPLAIGLLALLAELFIVAWKAPLP